jgi:hypothetical protein
LSVVCALARLGPITLQVFRLASAATLDLLAGEVDRCYSDRLGFGSLKTAVILGPSVAARFRRATLKPELDLSRCKSSDLPVSSDYTILTPLAMSRKYKIRDQDKLYFVTFTVIYWLDVFTRQMYRDIFLDAFVIVSSTKV